jgi:hypothetical protein
MHLRSGIVWFFGSSHGENLDRGHAASLPIIFYTEDGDLGFDLYPACHGIRVWPRYAPSVPPNTCLLGTCARWGLLVQQKFTHLRLYCYRLVSN